MAIKHTIKTKDGLKEVSLTRTAAIRAKCLDCVCWVREEVKLCPVKDCSLYPYRLGKVETDSDTKSPVKKKKRVLSKEHIAKLVADRKKAKELSTK